MITIRIRSAFAVGKTDPLWEKFFLGKNAVVEVRSGTTVEKLLHKMPWLGPPEEYDDMMLHVFVNGKQQPLDYVLVHNDVLDLHIPVSGG